MHLKRPDAFEIPERTKQLRRVIETSLPRIRIEDLLHEVDRQCGFTRELRPLSGYDPRVPNLYATQLAAVIAHGTNLRPHEHYTDTHGFTEQLFALCYLLGYAFMPRLRVIYKDTLPLPSSPHPQG